MNPEKVLNKMDLNLPITTHWPVLVNLKWRSVKMINNSKTLNRVRVSSKGAVNGRRQFPQTIYILDLSKSIRAPFKIIQTTIIIIADQIIGWCIFLSFSLVKSPPCVCNLVWKMALSPVREWFRYENELGDRILNQLLNSKIPKSCDLSVSRSIICLGLPRQITDLLATDNSQYFAQLWPNYCPNFAQPHPINYQ